MVSDAPLGGTTDWSFVQVGHVPSDRPLMSSRPGFKRYNVTIVRVRGDANTIKREHGRYGHKKQQDTRTAGNHDAFLPDVTPRHHVACHGIFRMRMEVLILGPDHTNAHGAARVGRRVDLEYPLNEDVSRLDDHVGLRGNVQHPLYVQSVREGKGGPVGRILEGARSAWNDCGRVRCRGGEDGSERVFGGAVRYVQVGIARERREHHVLHGEFAPCGRPLDGRSDGRTASSSSEANLGVIVPSRRPVGGREEAGQGDEESHGLQRVALTGLFLCSTYESTSK